MEVIASSANKKIKLVASLKQKKHRDGYILESETFSVFSSVGLQTDFWKRAFWIVALPVWRRSIMMWWIKSMSRMTIWD